jgi:metallo-beta-lactamase class B
MRLRRWGAALMLAGTCTALSAAAVDPESNKPVPPLKIAERIYYVGTNEIAIFLIDSGAGLILLDAGFEPTPPQVLANIRTLGFDPRQVRYLLNSQAHFDHAGGLAEMKRATGAKMLASVADAEILERGGRWDLYWGNRGAFPPVIVDEEVADGQQLKLGKVILTAHLTPGHTPGCTTWTMPVAEKGKSYVAQFNCSTSVPGYKLLEMPRYRGVVEDYRATFRKLKTIPCDIFLGAHASFFRLEEKRKALAANPARNPFIDPEGCRRHLANSERAFEEQLAREQSARRGS